MGRRETTLTTIEKINVEIAKSRIIELEVTGVLFSEEQARQVRLQIENLRKYINQLEGPVDPAQRTEAKARPQKT